VHAVWMNDVRVAHATRPTYAGNVRRLSAWISRQGLAPKHPVHCMYRKLSLWHLKPRAFLPFEDAFLPVLCGLGSGPRLQ
jgi:hypothetical protein